jgi:sulfonate transport system substrate-binding protein
VKSVKKLGTTIILLALAAALGACGARKSDAATSPSGGPDLSGVTLRIGNTGWNTFGAALQVAGFDNTPYKIKYSVFTGGDKQMQALQAGALDVAGASEIPPVFAAANTKPAWKAVVTGHSTTLLQEVDVAKSSTVNGIADLKGQKVGYVQNTTAQYFLVKLLQQNGLGWGDIKPVPLLPNDGVAALNSGAIAAFANYGNSVITIKQNGGREIGSGRDILSGNFVYLVGDPVLKDAGQKAAVADFFARLNKAYAVIRAGKEQDLAQKTADATHQPVAQALTQIQQGEAQRPTSYGPSDQTSITSEQAVADVFTSLGTIPKVDVAAFWSTELNASLTAALATYPV